MQAVLGAPEATHDALAVSGEAGEPCVRVAVGELVEAVPLYGYAVE
jgi:hypothetical protein